MSGEDRELLNLSNRSLNRSGTQVARHRNVGVDFSSLRRACRVQEPASGRRKADVSGSVAQVVQQTSEETSKFQVPADQNLGATVELGT
jgi:hypothetical protein